MGRRDDSDSDDERSRRRRRSSSSGDRSRSRSRDRHHRSRDADGDAMSSKDREALRSLWKKVKSPDADFDSWTHLLTFVERIDEMNSAREAYTAFLEHYPYCYGYWKKFADFERRHKNYERALEVYEKAVTAFPLSVDLWLAYLSYVKEIAAEREDGVGKVRALYERALSQCGLEFRSDTLWDECVNFELKSARPSPRRALALLDRVIRIPTLYYNTHFEKIQQIVNMFEPNEIVGEDEYEDALEHAQAQLNGQAYTVEPSNGANGDCDFKEKRYHSSDALRIIRAELLDKRKHIYQANEKEVSRRWSYEEAIKRPYFHVKPLERSQLRTWRSYLDFEEKHGSVDRVEILYERCLVACAMYEEFWIRYARWLQTHKKSAVEQIRAIYKRGAEVHCPKKPALHLAYAAFEEAQGSFESAVRILHLFERDNPNFPSVSIRRIGIERRRAKAERTGDSTDYSNVIARYEKLIHDSKTSRVISSFYALKFARFQIKIRNDRKLAEKIIKDALHRDRDNVQLHMALVDLHFTDPRFSLSTTLSAIDDALKADLPEAERIRFSQRKLDLLEEFSNDINAIQEFAEVHATLIRGSEHRLQSVRKRTERTLPDEVGGAEKRAKLEDPNGSAATSGMIQTVIGNTGPTLFTQPPPNVATGFDGTSAGTIQVVASSSAAYFDPTAAPPNAYLYQAPTSVTPYQA